MLHKARSESAELLILKCLHTRMNLSDKDKQYYLNLRKGYEGEVLFDSWTEQLQCDCLILNDLLLKLHQTTFQIDSLIITAEAIYVFEVKNYEGDYYYEDDQLYKKSNAEVTNPLNQLNRTESLLRQLLQNLGITMPVHAAVIFINPEFTLYQAPLDKPFIFPTQINRYIKTLNKLSSKLHQKHKLLADKLVSLHMKDSPFTLLPPYEYDQLRKGMTCSKCASFSISVEGRKCICAECGYEEKVAIAVMRHVEEFKILFPNRKITTNVIYDWCKVVTSKRRIRRILKQHFKIAGVHQWSFYE